MEIIKEEDIQFSYDGINITRMFLTKYAEKHEENTKTKAERYAMYKVINNISDEEVSKVLKLWTDYRKIKDITFEDWEKDCKDMWDIIKIRDEYKNQLIKFQRQGQGASGYGVYDKKRNEFTDIQFAEHMETTVKLLKKNYSDEFFCGEKLKDLLKKATIFSQPEDVTEEIEEFIKETFEMVNGMKSSISLRF